MKSIHLNIFGKHPLEHVTLQCTVANSKTDS